MNRSNHYPTKKLKPATQAQIAALAYELWLAQGRPEGKDLDFWLEAERLLRVGASLHRDPIPADLARFDPDDDQALAGRVEHELDQVVAPAPPRSPTAL